MEHTRTTTTMKRRCTHSRGDDWRRSLLPLGVVALTIATICLHLCLFSAFTDAFVYSTRTINPPPVTEWRIQQRQRLHEDGDMLSLSAQKESNLDSDSKKQKKKQVNDSTKTRKSGGGQPRSRLLIRANGSGTGTVSPLSPAVTIPDLTHYAVNRNNYATNQERLFHDKIACPHFGECSGCVVDSQMANIAIVESARRFFSSTAIRRQRVVDANQNNSEDDFYKLVIPSKVTTWRTQAKLAVAPKSTSWANAKSRSGCVFGLYQRGTHQVMPIPDCMVHHPSINQAIAALEMATAAVGTQATTISSSSSSSSFNSKGRGAVNNNNNGNMDGGLRYVQCQVERSTGKVSLTLVWHAEQFKETQPALPRLVKELQRIDPNLWHSIWCHCNNGYGNNIFHRGGSGTSRNERNNNKNGGGLSTAQTKGRQRWYRLMGPEYLREPIPRVNNGYDAAAGWLYYTPYTFRQGNSNGFDIIACDVAKAIPPGAKVCELYGGVGVLSLTALAHHHDGDGDNSSSSSSALKWIRCSDENPANPRCFALAVASLPESVTTRKRQSQATDATRIKRKKVDKKEMTLAEYAAMIDSGEIPSYQDSKNDDDDNQKTGYLVASATQALYAGEALGANVLIVDPPRKGLEEGVLEELCKPINRQQPYVESSTSLWVDDDEKSSLNWTNDVRTLIYVSCGFDALASDAEKLLFSSSGGGGGGWMLKSATGYILFPGSNHVETVCVFERR
jgi:23S rRNA (uracil1939-C5)-methyltransferase